MMIIYSPLRLLSVKILKQTAAFVKIPTQAGYIFKLEQPQSCFALAANDAGHQRPEPSPGLSEKATIWGQCS